MKPSERVRSITFAFGRNDDRHKSIRNLANEVANLEQTNVTLLEALKTLDRAHKKGFIDLKNFHNVPTEAILKAKGD